MKYSSGRYNPQNIEMVVDRQRSPDLYVGGKGRQQNNMNFDPNSIDFYEKSATANNMKF